MCVACRQSFSEVVRTNWEYYLDGCSWAIYWTSSKISMFDLPLRWWLFHHRALPPNTKREKYARELALIHSWQDISRERYHWSNNRAEMMHRSSRRKNALSLFLPLKQVHWHVSTRPNYKPKIVEEWNFAREALSDLWSWIDGVQTTSSGCVPKSNNSVCCSSSTG